MEMEYARTLEALACTLSPTLASDERTRIEAYLMEQKTHREFIQVLLHILTADSPAHTWDVRTLALTLLQDWMVLFWNEMSVDDQIAFRQAILQMAFCIGMSKGFKTKLASVLSNIAVRQFPQHWQRYIDDVLDILATSSTEIQELVIQTLDFTITDCIDFSLAANLPAARKQEVLGGVKAHLTPILTAVHSCLSSQFKRFLESRSNLKPQDPVVLTIIQAILKLIAALVAFSKPVDVCPSNHNFADMAVDLIQFEEFQHEGLSLLHAIVQYTLSLELLVLLMKKFCVVTLDVFGSHDETNFNIISFGESCHLLLSHNIGLLTEKHNIEFVASPTVQEMTVNYMKLLLSMLQIPINQLLCSVIGEWAKVRKG
jgi:hypothetical protein